MSGGTIRLVSAALGATWAVLAAAAPLPDGELERSCWLRHTTERSLIGWKDATAVDFANLRNNYRVRSPFRVDFSVKGMGVAPAGKPLKGAGHHHILVDTRMPNNPSAQIPFSDTHRHFGKGQTNTTLDLPAGQHTLRLLFADHEHRPYFVFSPEITIEVTGPRSTRPLPIDRARFDTTCEAWYQDEQARPRPAGDKLYVVNLREGEPVRSPFLLRIGVDGFGVAAAAMNAEKAGYFMVDIVSESRTLRTIDLSNGATQTNIELPSGSYILRLRLLEGTTGRPLLPAQEHALVVTR